MAQRASLCLPTSQESELPDPSGVMSISGLKTLRADHGSNQSPEVEDETDPAGGHLDPEHRPAPLQKLLNLMVIITAKKHTIRGVYKDNQRD